MLPMRVVAASAAGVAWVALWSTWFPGPPRAFGLFGLLAAWVVAATALRPPFARSWPRNARVGGLFAGAAFALMAMGDWARAAAWDPPYMERQTLPPLLLILAGASFLVAVWTLLGASRPRDEARTT